MSRATIEIDLNGGQQAKSIVTPLHILVRIDDKACLAHQRWFDRAEAAEMARTLTAFAEEAGAS